MGMLMASHALRHHHVDSVHAPTAHRPSWCTAIQTNGSSEDADLVPVQSGEDWIARLDDDLSQPAEISGDSFRISALQREDPVCITLHSWIVADEFPPWAEVKSMLPELRSLWHHRNNLSVDENGTLWRKRSSQSAPLQLLVPRPAGNNYFCLITLHCMVVTWDEHGPWRDWLTGSIGRECQMT